MECSVSPAIRAMCETFGVPLETFSCRPPTVRFVRVCPFSNEWEGLTLKDAVSRVCTELSSDRCGSREPKAKRPRAEIHPRGCGWLPFMVRLPAEVRIRGTRLDRAAAIAGIDAASAAACIALGVRPGQRVLDACAAPGSKLCLLADLMGRKGVLVGVDASEPRLRTARSLARDHGLLAAGSAAPGEFRLVLVRGDASEARLRADQILPVPASSALASLDPRERFEALRGICDAANAEVRRSDCAVLADSAAEALSRPKPRPKGRGIPAASLVKPAFRLCEALPAQPRGGRAGDGLPESVVDPCAGWAARPGADPPTGGIPGWDRILLDAPCTHDGSLRHLQKALGAGGGGSGDAAEAPPALPGLTVEGVVAAAALQSRLIDRAFASLREGGVLVYATCSQTAEQNERVVAALLRSRPDAAVEPIPGSAAWPCKPGSLPGTVRFDPLSGDTSGLFIARIRRRHAPGRGCSSAAAAAEGPLAGGAAAGQSSARDE